MGRVDRKAERVRRHARIRKHLKGTAERPRLSVFRSLHHIYAQIIDDEQGVTLVAAATNEPELKGRLESTKDAEAARCVGKTLAERALAKGIKQVRFDRGGHLYHGRVAALADAARESGLEF